MKGDGDTKGFRVPGTREQILELLQRSGGGLTADALAHKLGISAVAVRKHLAALERDNFVTTELERRPMGRPTYLYRPTATAQELFPNDYANLATAVLEMIRLLDGEHKVDELFQHRAQVLASELAARVREPRCRTPPAGGPGARRARLYAGDHGLEEGRERYLLTGIIARSFRWLKRFNRRAPVSWMSFSSCSRSR